MKSQAQRPRAMNCHTDENPVLYTTHGIFAVDKNVRSLLTEPKAGAAVLSKHAFGLPLGESGVRGKALRDGSRACPCGVRGKALIWSGRQQQSTAHYGSLVAMKKALGGADEVDRGVFSLLWHAYPAFCSAASIAFRAQHTPILWQSQVGCSFVLCVTYKRYG